MKEEPYVVRITKVYDKKLNKLKEWFEIPENEIIEYVRDIGDRIVIATYETLIDKRTLK